MQARKIKAVCERNPNDAVEIEFDQFAEFDVCAASYTPIYSGSPSSACPFDGVKYHSKYKGTVCKVCEVAQIGAPASGIRLFV
jgi:coatomer protein complex subunit alpha (xenin)